MIMQVRLTRVADKVYPSGSGETLETEESEAMLPETTVDSQPTDGNKLSQQSLVIDTNKD